MNSVVLEGVITGTVKVHDCICIFLDTGNGVFHCEINYDMGKHIGFEGGEKVRMVGRLETRQWFGGVAYIPVAEHIDCI